MTLATFEARVRGRPARRVAIRVASPRRTRTGEWICFVHVTLFLKRIGIRGEDGLQALCLALELLGQTLYRARKKGVQFVYLTGDAVPLHAYFRVRESMRHARARRRRALGKANARAARKR